MLLDFAIQIQCKIPHPKEEFFVHDRILFMYHHNQYKITYIVLVKN